MCFDETEAPRRELLAEINADPTGRAALEAKHGQVWDTEQLTEDFTVLGFMAPVIGVIRKSDHQKGSLYFQANPRFYFSFSPHKD